MPKMDSDDVESDAHSLELIECSLTNRVAVDDDIVADDDCEDNEDGLRCLNEFKSKFGCLLACLLQINKIDKCVTH